MTILLLNAGSSSLKATLMQADSVELARGQADWAGVPVVLAAIFAGRAINRRIPGRSFIRCIYVGLIAIGMLLLLQSLTRT